MAERVLRIQVNRRQMVAGAVGGAAIAAGGGPLVRAQTSTAASGTPAASCVLTPELTEGPYYVPDELVRQDITEGKAGVPLQLRIAVTDSASCAPLANAAVDVWHCDALGYYSGITGENPGGGGTSVTTSDNAKTTFLRGVQLTNQDGIVEFTTNYPGWYTGRTLHIHLKVHIGGAISAATPAGGSTGLAAKTYTGGHVAHTGQLFFDDAISDQVLKLAPYAAHTGQRTRNDGDNILDGHTAEPGFLLNLTPLGAGSVAAGYHGTITLAVNPAATPASTGPGGGPGQPPAGAPGT